MTNFVVDGMHGCGDGANSHPLSMGNGWSCATGTGDGEYQAYAYSDIIGNGFGDGDQFDFGCANGDGGILPYTFQIAGLRLAIPRPLPIDWPSQLTQHRGWSEYH